MSEKNINMCNKMLYYFAAPALLLYFFFIDIGIIKCSLTVLAIFSIVIAAAVALQLQYKKRDSSYKFEVNASYGKAMMILVFFELCFNFYK